MMILAFQLKYQEIIFSYAHVEKKQLVTIKNKVNKIELILNKEHVHRDDLKTITGKSIKLDKLKIENFIKDFNTKESAKAKWVSCAVIKISFKDGTFVSYICNGYHGEDIEGNEFCLGFNIIEKYWGIKERELCLTN